MIDRQELIALLDQMEVCPPVTSSTDQDAISFRETLADEIVKLADSTQRNVPRGLWRNDLGAELKVIGYVGSLTGVRLGNLRTLGGDISYAEAYDDLFKTTDPFIVTEDSLKKCGYELVEPESEEP